MGVPAKMKEIVNKPLEILDKTESSALYMIALHEILAEFLRRLHEKAPTPEEKEGTPGGEV
jgi:hypothetical protein